MSGRFTILFLLMVCYLAYSHFLAPKEQEQTTAEAARSSEQWTESWEDDRYYYLTRTDERELMREMRSYPPPQSITLSSGLVVDIHIDKRLKGYCPRNGEPLYDVTVETLKPLRVQR
ncbi:MAG: hypothetical protein EA357_03390 [Micavibrio sp.]|nr:MAG: hypothetical protein EA357_03390 [Micavibrio sp.]